MSSPTTVTTVLTTGKNKFKPTVNNCSTKQVNILLSDLADLISPAYKDWYALKFYSLPANRVMELASQARTDGKTPAKLFSYLLRRCDG